MTKHPWVLLAAALYVSSLAACVLVEGQGSPRGAYYAPSRHPHGGPPGHTGYHPGNGHGNGRGHGRGR